MFYEPDSANDELNGGIRWTHAWIRYDGTVTWKTNYILMSACPMNPLYFPFDTQNCSLKLGSWTYNEDEINVIANSTSGDATQYQPNGEWDLIDFPLRREVDVRQCCPGAYPSVIFNVIIKRQFLFYFFNLVVPCVIISSLVLLSFVLPSDACERITLTLTVLLSLTVFLLLVAETMPPTSEVVPLICKLSSYPSNRIESNRRIGMGRRHRPGQIYLFYRNTRKTPCTISGAHYMPPAKFENV